MLNWWILSQKGLKWNEADGQSGCRCEQYNQEQVWLGTTSWCCIQDKLEGRNFPTFRLEVSETRPYPTVRNVTVDARSSSVGYGWVWSCCTNFPTQKSENSDLRIQLEGRISLMCCSMLFIATVRQYVLVLFALKTIVIVALFCQSKKQILFSNVLTS